MPLVGSNGEPLNAKPQLESGVDDVNQAPIPCATRFIVSIGEDGAVNLYFDDVPLQPRRRPHFDEVYGACDVVRKDIAAQETSVSSAMNTVEAMKAEGQKQMEAMKTAQLQAQVQQAEEARRRGAKR